MAAHNSQTPMSVQRNQFSTVANWTAEKLRNVNIQISDIKETTSEFTRKKYPKKRYWKANITFKEGQYSSRILKMSACPVPYLRQANYGTEFVYAELQKCVGDAIVKAGLDKSIIITMDDAKLGTNDNQWWCTINNINGRVGVIDGTGRFDPRDLGTIFMKTEEGARITFDLVFSLRLTLDDNGERGSHHAFRIVPDCSRGAIKALRQDIAPPEIDSQIPQQKATKEDVASQELIDAIDALLL